MKASKAFGGLMLGWLFTGLFAFLIFLIPGVDFLAGILGGSVQNLDSFLGQILGAFTNNPGLGFAGYAVATLGEGILFYLFPLSWVISYRPDDIGTVFLMIAPWLIAGFLTGVIVGRQPKDGLQVGLSLIIANIIWDVALFIVLPTVLANVVPGGGDIITSVLGGVAEGATDLPLGLSAILVNLEGGAFFIGTCILGSGLRHGEEVE